MSFEDSRWAVVPILVDSDAILTDAGWPEGVRVPVGWMVDGDSGRLKRAGGLSEVTVGFDLLT